MSTDIPHPAHFGMGAQYDALILKEAERICDTRLRDNPDTPSLLHLRGLIALRDGQDELGLACLMRAVTTDSCNPALLSDLGEALGHKERYVEALDVLSRAVALAPHDFGPRFRLGGVLKRLGQLIAAAHIYQQLLQLAPHHAQAYRELGEVYELQGHHAAALEHYRRALELQPLSPETFRRLGRVYLHQGQLQDSLHTFQEGLQRDWNHTGLHIGLGEVLLRLGAMDDALTSFRNALTISPHDVQACSLFVCTLELMEHSADSVGAWCSLALALRTHGRLEESLTAYKQALRRKKTSLVALVGLGSAYLELAQAGQAIRPLEAALALDREHAVAHQLLGWAYAATGDLERNWQEIAWYDAQGPYRRFEQPIWDGSTLDRKTILLWINAGLGDTIQHLRFVPRLKALGARVVIECDRTLVPLIRRMPCVDCVVARHTPLPHFDVQALFASLPRIFNTDLFTIPNHVPYLTVEPQLIETWRQRLGPNNRRGVGLVWGSKPTGWDMRMKSAPLSAFAALGGITKVRFISLQLGPQAAEAFAPPPGLTIESPLDSSCTVADTAALIMNLDLVVTVDTMVAHLAGALGRPVWTMLRYAADWRWQANRDTSPWYPTMRLFRQEQSGDWSDVLQRVRTALDEVVASA